MSNPYRRVLLAVTIVAVLVGAVALLYGNALGPVNGSAGYVIAVVSALIGAGAFTGWLVTGATQHNS